MIYGFLSFNSVLSNSHNTINPVGELSEKAITYSRSMDEYAGFNSNLTIFDIGAITGAQLTATPSSMRNLAMVLDNIPDYVINSNEVLANVTAAIGTSVINLTVGPAVVNPMDGKDYPSWIQFDYESNGYLWPVKVWLANDAFIQDYPLGQFQFIYPIVNLMDLYNNYASASLAVSQLTPISMTQLARSEPSLQSVALTGYDTLSLTVYNRANTSQFFEFPILIAYNGGSLFNNPVAYLTAFRNYLLTLSSHTLNDWLGIIPDLQPIDTYYINVNWKNTALSSHAIAEPYSQIGSPTIPVIDVPAFKLRYFNGLTIPEVSDYLDYSIMMYKSLGFFSLPGLDNASGRISFRNAFSDYFIVAINDVNVQQMSPRTQELQAMLAYVVKIAETFQPSNLLPSDVTLEHHNGFDYICKLGAGVKLNVLTRESEMRVI